MLAFMELLFTCSRCNVEIHEHTGGEYDTKLFLFDCVDGFCLHPDTFASGSEPEHDTVVQCLVQY